MKDEIVTKLLGRITLMFPNLNVNVQKQLELRRNIEEILYGYNISLKNSKEIWTSDIKEKGELFLKCKRQEGCSKNTLEWYTYMLKPLELFFNKPISTITTADLRLFLDSLQEDKKGKSTINSYITRLRVFFKWLQEEGYIITDPAVRIKKAKLSKIIKKPYSSITVEKLRNACEKPRDKALFEVLESTACRIGEIVNIKVSDLNLMDRSILVTGKGTKQRVVYFSSRAQLFIEDYLKCRKGDSEYLFLALKSPYRPLTDRGIRYMLGRIKEKAEIKERVFPHRFRRTKATNLLNSGMSLQGVQQFLGHENPSTTEVYATLNEENLKIEYKRLTK